MVKKIINPFAIYSDRVLLFVGILATVTGFLLAYFLNAIFDGAIDLHFVDKSNLQSHAGTALIALLSMVICLYAAAYFINPKTRLRDIIVVVMIARIPIYAEILTNINDYQFLFSEKLLKILPSSQANPDALITFLSDNIFWIIANVIISLGMLIFFFILLFNGFKTATNLKKPLHILLFVAAIILAEIISKTLIYLFF